MSTISSHDFAHAQLSRIRYVLSSECELIVRQQPLISRVGVGKEKDRKPVDPPPIVQLKIHSSTDTDLNYLQSPYFFVSCSLVGLSEAGVGSGTSPNPANSLGGTIVSSLHRLKDPETQQDGAYFVFGDLSVKVEGTFRLQFNLFELRGAEYQHLKTVTSKPFLVHSTKTFPGMNESTKLTRAFGEQGVRLRIRKEPRSLLRKRGPASDDYQPRQYIKKAKEQEGDSGSRDINKYKEKEPSDSAQPSQQETFDQSSRTQQGRQYNQISSSSHNSYVEEPPTRQQGIGSDPSQQQASHHSPGFGQNDSLDGYDWSRRQFTEMQGPSFSNPHFTQQPQLQNYEYNNSNYAPSPTLVTTPIRDQFFANRLSSTHLHESPQPDNSNFELHSQRSPPSFYAQQPNSQFGRAMQSSIPVVAAPTQAQRHSANYQNVIYQSRPQLVAAPATSIPLPSSVIGRGNMPSEYMTYGRRDDFDTLQGQSLGGMSEFPEQIADNYAPRSSISISTAVTTTAPDMGNY
ncbi:hypothetical protein ACMFMG_007651 [Clarireedia jacksonii]